MLSDAKWIWLDESAHADGISAHGGYCVAEISKAYRLMKTGVKLRVQVSADTVYKLWINGAFVGSGPTYPLDKMSFYSEYEIPSAPDTLLIKAVVRKCPGSEAESSHGEGGFILSCDIEYDDGTVENVCTDEKWDVRYLPCHISDTETDFTVAPCAWEKAVDVHYNAALAKSPIPQLVEHIVLPDPQEMYVCPKHSMARFCVAFPALLIAYPMFSADGDDYEITLELVEGEDIPARTETIHAYGRIDYVSIQYTGVSKLIINVVNNGKGDVKIFDVQLIRSEYPTIRKAAFSCSDEELCSIWQNCVGTLENCRRDSYIESPTSKKFISAIRDIRFEALFSQVAFGDVSLARFDILKLSERIKKSAGEIENSAGLLSFMPMIWDYYMYTEDASLFEVTEETMTTLLDVFDSYLSDAKIIDVPPDYAPVDNMKIGGYSLENPPKALGQAVITALYYKALDIASKIYAERGNNKLRTAYRLRADAVKKGFETAFFDRERQLCFAGLATKDKKTCRAPKNPGKKYYTRHVNVLAALYGLCDSVSAKQIALRIATDKSLGDVQPGFMAYLLETVLRYGLFEKHGMKLIRRWKDFGDKCKNGVGREWDSEGKGFGYGGGCAPAYYLPLALLGFEMVRPGFEEIKLAPHLYGLESANISIPTPYGYITANMERGKPADITIPSEIKYTIV